MTTLNTIPDTDRRGLRDFGIVTGGLFAGLFGLAFPWVLEKPIPMWPWGLALALSIWALLAPDSLRPLYRLWMRLGLLLNRVSTPLILGIIFCFLIVPAGAILRIAGKDPMARDFDRKAKSYRVTSRKAPIENMEKPY